MEFIIIPLLLLGLLWALVYACFSLMEFMMLLGEICRGIAWLWNKGQTALKRHCEARKKARYVRARDDDAHA